MEFVNRLKDLLVVKHPMVFVQTWEEDRAESYITKVSESIYHGIKIFKFTNLLKDSSETTAEKLKNYIKLFLTEEKPALLILNDPQFYWKENPTIVRFLKDLYFELKRKTKFLFFISSIPSIPFEIKRLIEIIELPFPTREELKNILKNYIKSYSERGKTINLSPEELEESAISLQGLSFDETKRLLNMIFYKTKTVSAEIIKEIQEYKKRVILKEGVLEYVPSTWSIDDIGGLDNLKDWLIKRKDAFSEEAIKFGLTPPKGILVMGITGCGKSLSIKTIASLWNIPMFRLDMNLVYSGIAGPPEEAFMRALKTLEAMAPSILWIDEIESGITHKHSEGPTSRVLGYFLTWLQEKKADIFVAATANRIDMLPAELLRRGRFDQIFFIDLPTEKERIEIFKIHLQKRGNDPERFDLVQLAKITKGWSGAEIEEAIKSAMYEAFNQKRPLNEDDLYKIFGNTVPLSTTMAEQIKYIRSWAHRRAVRASSEEPEV